MPLDPNEAPEGYEAKEGNNCGLCVFNNCCICVAIGGVKLPTVVCLSDMRKDKTEVYFVRKEDKKS